MRISFTDRTESGSEKALQQQRDGFTRTQPNMSYSSSAPNATTASPQRRYNATISTTPQTQNHNNNNRHHAPKMTSTKKGNKPKESSRLSILRSKIISLLLSHLQSLSVILFLIGLILLIMMPFMDRNIYFSENALSVGNFHYSPLLDSRRQQYPASTGKRNAAFHSQIAHLYRHLLPEYNQFLGRNSAEMGSASPHGNLFEQIQHYFTDNGFEESLIHTFHTAPQETEGFSYIGQYKTHGQQDAHTSNQRRNFYTSVRAVKSTGKESFVILVPLRCNLSEEGSQNCNEERLWNLVLGMVLMRNFSLSAKWLNKDVIFVVTDHRGEETFSSDELRKTLSSTPKSHNSTSVSQHTSPFLPEEIFLSQQRFSTGKIREAVILDFSDFNFEYLSLLTEGFNGELPNLDMLNVVNFFANREGLETSYSRKHSQYVSHSFLEKALQFKWAREYFLSGSKKTNLAHSELLHQWDEYIMKYVTITRHMLNQLLSLPTGLHAPFRRRTIHTITMTNGVKNEQGDSHTEKKFLPEVRIDARKAHRPAKKVREENLLAVARIVEGTLRSMNNLLEELHQSFFLYFMDAANTFMGFEDFSPSMWLIVLPLTFLKPIGSFYAHSPSGTTVLRSFSVTLMVALLCGIFVFMIPFLITQLSSALQLQWLDFAWTLRLWCLLSACLFFSAWFFYPRIDSRCKKTFAAIDWAKSNYSKHNMRESSRMFAFIYCGIGMLTLLPISPALAIFVGIYVGLLNMATSRSSESTKGLRYCFRLVWRLLQTIVLFVLQPFSPMILAASSSKVQDMLLASGFADNMYEHLIFTSYCLVVVPTWSMLFLLTWFRNE